MAPPDTLRVGARSPAVYFLQAELNRAYPHFLKPLKVDGKFGLKTLERVQRFQRDRYLGGAGTVGPATWAALADVTPGYGILTVKPPIIHCGNCLAENKAYSDRMAAAARAAEAKTIADEPANTTVLEAFGKSAKVLPLAKSRLLTKAKTAFKKSLDYSRIFMSDASGAENRPFTVSVSLKSVGPIVIMNVGTLVPSDDVLLHELVHAWQSQHHSDPTKFMRHCLECQAEAVKVNLALLYFDLGLRHHDEFPMQYPFSAYAFHSSAQHSDYGGEQMAQAFELDHGTVRSFVSGVGPGPDAVNIASLADTDGKIADRRDPNVKV